MAVELPPPSGLRDRFQRLGRIQQGFLLFTAASLLALVPAGLHTLEFGLFPNFVMMILTQIAVYAIASLGLNIVTGYTGQLNLGFCAFMAIGAYTTGLLMRDGLPGSEAWYSHPWPFWAAIPVAVLHAGIWGVLLGLPILKLTGDYFAIVTFGFAELTVLTAKNWDSATGGAQGLKNIPAATLPLPFGRIVEFTTGPWKMGPVWVLAVLLLVLAFYFTWRIVHSRVGLAWRAIAEDEIAAQACGVDLRIYKSLAFFVSAALGGLAGSVIPILFGGVYVTQFIFIYSVYILAYVVLGGMGSFAGSLLGPAILISTLELLRKLIEIFNEKVGEAARAAGEPMPFQIDPELRMMVYGILLILVVRFRPEGLFPSRRVTGELHPDSQRVSEAGDDSLFDLRNPSAGRLT